jgi:hypothetical protein
MLPTVKPAARAAPGPWRARALAGRRSFATGRTRIPGALRGDSEWNDRTGGVSATPLAGASL